MRASGPQYLLKKLFGSESNVVDDPWDKQNATKVGPCVSKGKGDIPNDFGVKVFINTQSAWLTFPAPLLRSHTGTSLVIEANPITLTCVMLKLSQNNCNRGFSSLFLWFWIIITPQKHISVLLWSDILTSASYQNRQFCDLWVYETEIYSF